MVTRARNAHGFSRCVLVFLEEQTHSMEKLLAYRFASVLPGHGRIHLGTPEEMHEHLERCVARMKQLQ